jgi:hypothetical protein
MIDMAAQRERIWGLAGGAIGAAFGISSALIAMVVDGAPASSCPTYQRKDGGDPRPCVMKRDDQGSKRQIRNPSTKAPASAFPRRRVKKSAQASGSLHPLLPIRCRGRRFEFLSNAF